MADRAPLPGDPVEGEPVEGATLQRVPVEGGPVEAEPVEAPTLQRVPVEGEPVEATPAAPRRRLPSPARLSPVVATRILVALLLLATLLAVVFFLQASGLRRAEALRRDAREAAEVIAARVTTFRGEDIDAWVQRTQELSTGEYAEEVAGLFDQELRTVLRDNDVESVGEVLQSYVQDVEDDEATVFVIVRQTSSSSAQPQPVQDELRMEVELAREEGRWLAASVAVLGRPLLVPSPDGAQGPPPTADPAAAPTGGRPEPGSTP